jgi:hypothetical protein
MSVIPRAGLLVVACCVAAGAWAGDAPASSSAWVVDSRALSQRLGNTLRGRLSIAMGNGPEKAIEVCRSEAPALAAQLSRDSGAHLRRTSTRVRNPANAPDSWDASAMREMARRIAAGEPASQVEVHAVVDGRRRYAKAIVMEPMCAMCHGERLAPAVEAAVRASYPVDAATGFKAGELRGAFSVSWP